MSYRLMSGTLDHAVVLFSRCACARERRSDMEQHECRGPIWISERRTVAKDGTVEFHNLTTGTKSKENPIIRIHQQLVRRARLEARPKLSVLSDLYTYAPARFEPGTLDEHGMPRKTKVRGVKGCERGRNCA